MHRYQPRIHAKLPQEKNIGTELDPNTIVRYILGIWFAKVKSNHRIHPLWIGPPVGSRHRSVGAARNPPVFMDAGDVIEVEVKPIGVLRHPVIVG